MITKSDSWYTVNLGDYFAILPRTDNYSIDNYCKSNECKPVPKSFSYNSATNEDFLTVEEIRYLIRENVDSKFKK